MARATRLPIRPIHIADSGRTGGGLDVRGAFPDETRREARGAARACRAHARPCGPHAVRLRFVSRRPRAGGDARQPARPGQGPARDQGAAELLFKQSRGPPEPGPGRVQELRGRPLHGGGRCAVPAAHRHAVAGAQGGGRWFEHLDPAAQRRGGGVRPRRPPGLGGRLGGDGRDLCGARQGGLLRQDPAGPVGGHGRQPDRGEDPHPYRIGTAGLALRPARRPRRRP